MIALVPLSQIKQKTLALQGPFSNRVPPVNNLCLLKAVWTKCPSASASKSRYFPNNRTQWSVDGM
jgi:hypothetical protein